jgi:hypothetical protein
MGQGIDAVTHNDLLQKIAQTLKQDIGPAIEAEYPKTQAFLAGVVLQKLGLQLALASSHQAAEQADLSALLADLKRLVDGSTPMAVTAALARLAAARDQAELCALIQALYAAREALGGEHFSALLGRVRKTLRANIERQLEYAA